MSGNTSNGACGSSPGDMASTSSTALTGHVSRSAVGERVMSFFWSNLCRFLPHLMRTFSCSPIDTSLLVKCCVGSNVLIDGGATSD